MRNPTTHDTDRKHRMAVLRVMCIALMMVVASVASLNVALPGISSDTGATQTQLQWIVDAYSLAFAALLLPAGALGDRLGRKPVLVFGLSVFGLASVAAMFASSADQLIALRAVMGVGAAFTMPVTLSVITSIFPPEERGKAVGTWVGVAAGGAVVGLLGSGIVLELLSSWQAIFGLNVFMASIALVGTLKVVPATRESHPPRLDPIGTVLSVGGLAALVYGIIEGPERGWGDAFTAAGLVIGAVGLVAFVLWELRRDEPMLDPRHFLRRGFSAGSLSVTVQFFAAFGFLFLALPYLQEIQGFSALESAAALLPMALVVMPLSRLSPHIAARVGVRVTSVAGLSSMAVGFLIFTSLDSGSSYWHFVAGLLPFGAGMALAGSPATAAIVASLPRSKQGVASAVNDVSRELGGALGIAILGSFLNDAYRSSIASSAKTLPASLADKATESFGSAQAIGHEIGGQAGHDLVANAQDAWLHGFSRSLTLGAAMLIGGAIFIALRAPGRAESKANARSAAPEPAHA
jgi:EmrB/QacA subfamily drug resistance transporter